MASASSHGAESRRPVVHGGRRIPSLWQRDLKDGGVAYEASLRLDGKKRRVVLSAQTPTEAMRELEALRVDRDRGVAGENPLLNPTVSELFDELLEHMQGRVGIADERRRYSQRTVDSYRKVERLYLRSFMGRRLVRDLRPADLRRLIDRLQKQGLAHSSMNSVLVALSAALTFAVKNGYVERNVCRDLPREDRPSSKRATEPRYLTADEVGALLELAGGGKEGPMHRALLACMAYAALRVSETLGLRWENVDFGAEKLRITHQLGYPKPVLVPTKTPESAATLPMAPALKRDLLAHRSRQAERNLAFVRAEAFVFCSPTGAPREQSFVGHQLRRIGDLAGLNPEGIPAVTPHDLRHTAIALAIKSGAPITEVCEFARHANPGVTLRAYAGLAEDSRGGAMRRMLDAGFGV